MEVTTTAQECRQESILVKSLSMLNDTIGSIGKEVERAEEAFSMFCLDTGSKEKDVSECDKTHYGDLIEHLITQTSLLQRYSNRLATLNDRSICNN